MNTIIIATQYREPLITKYVEYLNPITSYGFDYPHAVIGQFRCFHSHTNALTCYMTDPTALVFEDDCVPDENLPWKEVIKQGNELVLSGLYDINILHGRGFDFEKFQKFKAGDFFWLEPTTTDRWVLGTLAYIINEKAAELFCKSHFWLHGTNIDLFLWSHRFNFCMLDPRQFVKDKSISETLIAENPPPFKHACGAEDSVLQNPRNRKYVNA